MNKTGPTGMYTWNGEFRRLDRCRRLLLENQVRGAQVSVFRAGDRVRPGKAPDRGRALVRACHAVDSGSPERADRADTSEPAATHPASGVQGRSHRNHAAARPGPQARADSRAGADGGQRRHRRERRAGPVGFSQPTLQRRVRQRDAGQSVSARSELPRLHRVAAARARRRVCRSTWTACGSISRSAMS